VLQLDFSLRAPGLRRTARPDGTQIPGVRCATMSKHTSSVLLVWQYMYGNIWTRV